MKNIFYAISGCFLLAGQLAAAPLTEPPTHRTLEFIPNQGQWAPEIRYAGNVPGGHLYLEPSGLHYVLLQELPHPHRRGSTAPKLPAADSLIRGHQLRVRFVGADQRTPLVPAEATGEIRNYLLGNDPKAWASQVPSYRQVRYQAPWPGIGARFYENEQRELEYDFELEAGADPALVQLKYDGASKLSLSHDGRLHVGTSLGELTELAPRAYQPDPTTGERRPVACRYRLRAADSTVTFELGRYDHSRPLVIDPTVQFSTYSGASGDNWGFTATYDAAGNMYSGGIVLNNGSRTPSYPVTTGAFQTSFGGTVDIAIIKYNTAVNGAASRVWATYLGGAWHDFPSSLVANSQGELLVLGTTASSNYPTTAGAYQRSFGGGTPADPFGYAYLNSAYDVSRGTDLVVTRLSSNGGSLAASTYVGGSGTDGLVPFSSTSSARQLPQNYGDAFRGDILTDAAGNVYVASVTNSTNFPTTAGSFGSSRPGGPCDAVVFKLPAALNALTWSGYLGGSAADAAYSLQLDGSSNVYVAGGTLSTNFPITTGAYSTRAAGDVDGFVARIAADGSAVQRASYVGTSNYDQAFFVQLGSDGGVYLLGQTAGAWPVSGGVYSNAGSRQFIQKMNPDLSQRLLSTVFGSGRPTLDITPTAFLVDQCDRVYVCGWGGQVNQNIYSSTQFNFNGYTSGMPVTANAVRTTPDSPVFGSDFYLAQFTPGLGSLLYGTYYGDAGVGSEGDHVDGGTSRFDPRGVAYAAACACFDVAGFPVPPGAYTFSTANGTTGLNCNNAAFKLNFEPTVATVGSDQTVCANAAPVALVGSPAGGIWSGPGVTGSVATGFVFTPSLALVGVQTATYTLPGAIIACTATGQQRFTVQPLAAATLTGPQATYCLQAGITAPSVVLSGSPAGGTFSGPGVANGVFSPAVAGPGLHTLTYVVPGTAAACGNGTSLQVRVVGATVAPTLAACVGNPPLALGGTPAGGTWSGPGVSGSVAAGFVFTSTTALLGSQTLTYTVSAPDNSCAGTARTVVTVSPVPVVTVQPLPTLCQNGNPYTLTGGSPAGGTWSGPGVSAAAGGTYVFTPAASLAGANTLTYAVTNAGNCTGQASTTLQVVPMAIAAVPADTTLCPGSTKAFQLRGTPAGGTWSGPHVAASGVYTPTGLPGTDVLTYTVSTGLSCQSQAVRRVVLLATPTLTPALVPGPCTPALVVPYAVHFTQNATTLPADAIVTWYFGDDSTAVTGLDVTHVYRTAGTFRPRVQVRYNNSRCGNVAALPTVTLQPMLVPNIITPTSNTLNARFSPRVGGCPPRLQLYSRWGRQVLDEVAYQGTWNAEGLAAGLYYYLLTPTDGSSPIKGWVEVVK